MRKYRLSFVGIGLSAAFAAAPVLAQVTMDGTPPATIKLAPKTGTSAAPITATPSATSPAAAAGLSDAAVTKPAINTFSNSPSSMPATPGLIVPNVMSPATTTPGTSEPAPTGADAVPAANPPVSVAKPKKVVPPPPPRETAIGDDPTPSFQPETFFSTAKASERYAAIADAGGWPVIEGPLRAGDKDRPVLVLRKRLIAEQDLDTSAANSGKWDTALTNAVKHFQMRHGLRQTGVVAGATLKAMNVSAAQRFKQLASSAQRLAGVNFSFGDRYVVVNIPSAAVEAVENGRVAHHYIAVVGDIDHRSPEVEARISAVNLNPTWTVPTSIIKNEIIPHMRKDAGYLTRAKIRILDNQGNEVHPTAIDWNSERAVNYILRQDSGASNSLGAIRIQMNNKYSVYMHDTPSKRFFGADYRFLSHGCVRVQGVYDYAAWLLEGTIKVPEGVWTRKDIEEKVATTAREDIKLDRPIPVAWVYMTGWASADEVVHFRDDVYGYDTIGGEPMASK